jgi:ribosomal protein S18 acetylase RimI-like enzyme
MHGPEVLSASENDQSRVLDVITLAFSDDPMVRWALPDPATFLRVMPELARAFGGKGFAHQTVDLTDGGFGAAMWLPPEVSPDSERMLALVEQNIPERQLPDMMVIFEQMEAYHPVEPHWYLPLIGVDPAHQGRGYGSAMLAHALARCDEQQLPAYLESSSPRNIPLYQRYGFEITGRIQAGSSPAIVPMLRRPR